VLNPDDSFLALKLWLEKIPTFSGWGKTLKMNIVLIDLDLAEKYQQKNCPSG